MGLGWSQPRVLEVENCEPAAATAVSRPSGPPCVYLDAQPDCGGGGSSNQERGNGSGDDFWAECEREVLRGQREIERVLACEERRARRQVAGLFHDKQAVGTEPCLERARALARCLEGSPCHTLDCSAELRDMSDCADRSRLDKLTAEGPDSRLMASRGISGPEPAPAPPEPRSTPTTVSSSDPSDLDSITVTTLCR